MSYVCIDSWAGRDRVPVEVVGKTPKRVRVRFLRACQKGPKGAERFVAPSVVLDGDVCAACDGRGEVGASKCARCEGSGR